jgi:broad specificity phosphatase PhoE
MNVKIAMMASVLLISSPLNATKPAVTASLQKADTLVPRLQKGGLIIVMRHQRTQIAGRWDDFSRPPSECAAQRNLSPAGYAAALETGQVFEKLDIAFGVTVASPMCRTMETARLIFSRAEPKDELRHISGISKFDDKAAAKGLIDTVNAIRPENSRNVAVVTHGGNILAAYGENLSEGEMLFFEPTSGGFVKLIGRASPSDFDLAANEAVIKKSTEANARP